MAYYFMEIYKFEIIIYKSSKLIKDCNSSPPKPRNIDHQQLNEKELLP